MDKTNSPATEIERRMEAIAGDMRGIGEMLVGSISVNRNRKARKRKEGEYVSPPHYTFNYKDEAGKPRWKRIRPESVERIRALVGNGRRWEQLAKEYGRLATRLALEGGSKKHPAAAPPAAPARRSHPGA
ncbi:MAG: hypothetical protein J6Y19_11785 [Kiritimatiellae bacterium]|nr:hypothetical protein [Kiritimatiellia bacterium]